MKYKALKKTTVHNIKRTDGKIFPIRLSVGQYLDLSGLDSDSVELSSQIGGHLYAQIRAGRIVKETEASDKEFIGDIERGSKIVLEKLITWIDSNDIYYRFDKTSYLGASPISAKVQVTNGVGIVNPFCTGDTIEIYRISGNVLIDGLESKELEIVDGEANFILTGANGVIGLRNPSRPLVIYDDPTDGPGSPVTFE